MPPGVAREGQSVLNSFLYCDISRTWGMMKWSWEHLPQCPLLNWLHRQEQFSFLIHKHGMMTVPTSRECCQKQVRKCMRRIQLGNWVHVPSLRSLGAKWVDLLGGIPEAVQGGRYRELHKDRQKEKRETERERGRARKKNHININKFKFYESQIYLSSFEIVKAENIKINDI